MPETEAKFNILKEYLKGLNSAVVAFSAGVDSTFLLKTAHSVLSDKVIAITGNSPLFPKRELEEAVKFCRNEGIKHIIVDLDVFQADGFCDNPENRCYICKKYIFSEFIKIAKEYNIEHILEGSNTDDDGDYRPGMKAVFELGIKSPLKIASLNKEEIRSLSGKLGLKTADKPSFACLASRFVYGEKITNEKLEMVERAEETLYSFGFRQFRVRKHFDIARIEVLPDEFDRVLAQKEVIVEKFAGFGFKYVTLDLAGYRTGSMNVGLKSRI